MSSAHTDSDLVSQLVLVHLREATPSFFSYSTSGFCFILWFRWCVYVSLCWPLLTSLASFCLCDQRNHKLAEHVHVGDAVRLRRGEKRALFYRLRSATPTGVLLISESLHKNLQPPRFLWWDLIPCFRPGWTRPVLLPDFRGLHHLQRCVFAGVCSRDQRKDNGGDNTRLWPSELQELCSPDITLLFN